MCRATSGQFDPRTGPNLGASSIQAELLRREASPRHEERSHTMVPPRTSRSTRAQPTPFGYHPALSHSTPHLGVHPGTSPTPDPRGNVGGRDREQRGPGSLPTQRGCRLWLQPEPRWTPHHKPTRYITHFMAALSSLSHTHTRTHTHTHTHFQLNMVPFQISSVA